MASLRFQSGPRAGEAVELDKSKITFGRTKTRDCVLAHPTVSREHFYIERNNGKLFLVDQGSENGTLANSERITWIELKDGDQIQAGPFTLVLVMTDSETETRDTDEDVTAAQSRANRSFDSSTTTLLPAEYLQGIEHFNAGRYFDAHEVWEEIWLRSSGETKLFYQMLIQAAVGLHHYERGNHRGARGMHANVVEKLSRLPSVLMQLDLVEFSRQFKAYFTELIENNNDSCPVDQPRPRIRPGGDADWSL